MNTPSKKYIIVANRGGWNWVYPELYQTLEQARAKAHALANMAFNATFKKRYMVCEVIETVRFGETVDNNSREEK